MKNNNWWFRTRRRAARFVVYGICRMPIGCVAPRWVRWLFFPIYTASEKWMPFWYDPNYDVLTFFGMKFSVEFFRVLANENIGARFKIVQRDNFIIRLDRLEDEHEKDARLRK